MNTVQYLDALENECAQLMRNYFMNSHVRLDQIKSDAEFVMSTKATVIEDELKQHDVTIGGDINIQTEQSRAEILLELVEKLQQVMQFTPAPDANPRLFFTDTIQAAQEHCEGIGLYLESVFVLRNCELKENPGNRAAILEKYEKAIMNFEITPTPPQQMTQTEDGAQVALTGAQGGTAPQNTMGGQ